MRTKMSKSAPISYQNVSIFNINFKQFDKQNLFIYILSMKDTSIANLTGIYLYKIQKIYDTLSLN